MGATSPITNRHNQRMKNNDVVTSRLDLSWPLNKTHHSVACYCFVINKKATFWEKKRKLLGLEPNNLTVHLISSLLFYLLFLCFPLFCFLVYLSTQIVLLLLEDKMAKSWEKKGSDIEQKEKKRQKSKREKKMTALVGSLEPSHRFAESGISPPEPDRLTIGELHFRLRKSFSFSPLSSISSLLYEHTRWLVCWFVVVCVIDLGAVCDLSYCQHNSNLQHANNEWLTVTAEKDTDEDLQIYLSAGVGFVVHRREPDWLTTLVTTKGSVLSQCADTTRLSSTSLR